MIKKVKIGNTYTGIVLFRTITLFGIEKKYRPPKMVIVTIIIFSVWINIPSKKQIRKSITTFILKSTMNILKIFTKVKKSPFSNSFYFYVGDKKIRISDHYNNNAEYDKQFIIKL